MYRCVVESPAAVAVKGVMRVLDRSIEDQPDDSDLVAAAPWAFERLDGPIEEATARPGEKRSTRRPSK